MRLLQLSETGQFSLTKNLFNNFPPFAILSHTWYSDEDEVTFHDMLEGTGRKKLGYKKIELCGAQAERDGLRHFWVDTCCIDKTNSTELSDAINSMFKWYEDAKICYAYLSDIHLRDLGSSRWFRRGWTLQELLAPQTIVFFNSKWMRLGTKSSLSPTIARVTGINRFLLLHSYSGEHSAARVMSWAARRETTREEDLAYCLLGLFGVNMPLLYGEGARAFERLQKAIIMKSTDHSLFSWMAPKDVRSDSSIRGPFAWSPGEFRNCGHITARDGES